MELILGQLDGPPMNERSVEIVECKGLGHPDTLCDALAEELSLALSRFYLARFGHILHHNVDKALLWAGSSRPAFGGGEVVAPMELTLAGRAVASFEGVRVPIEEMVEDGSRRWLKQHLHALDAEEHVKIHSRVRVGSADLVDLFRRETAGSGAALANDTSCGVGYAPESELERIAKAVERWLTAAPDRDARPFVGEDVKVMGVRRGDRIALTVACAFVDRHVSSLGDYLDAKMALADAIAERGRKLTSRPVEVSLNAADDPARESVYLTVTGTSAEAGDDGQAGRGNRINGLITPYRPMTMESVAGKNPVTHVGKLYNALASRVSRALVEEIPEVAGAHCWIVSRIGRRVDDPQVVDVRIRSVEPGGERALASQVDAIVRDHVARVADLARELVERGASLDS